MKVLLLNQDWMKEELQTAGHEVMTCGLMSHLDIRFDQPLLHIDTLLSSHSSKFAPDVIINWDNSAPLWIAGIDETPIPTLFYSVDTHHHLTIHRYLDHIFDYTLVAQRDYIPAFSGSSLPEWMPLWASRYVEASARKDHGAVFVGTLNPALNPDRVAFFENLQKKVPMICMSGAFWEIFPHSEIVVNQTVKGDLNFRVFEAMMTGALLLTERTPNGLFDLFNEGEHLITYQRNNVEEAAEKIHYYLAHPEEARRIGQNGRNAILAAHCAKHRAARILEILPTLKKRPNRRRFFSSMVNFTILGHRLEKLDDGLANRSYLHAMRSAEQGIEKGEIMDEDIASAVVYSAINYDRRIGSNAGERLLFQISEAYPENVVLSMASLRAHLNRGRRGPAQELAQRFGVNQHVETLFQKAEVLVSSILSGSLL